MNKLLTILLLIFSFNAFALDKNAPSCESKCYMSGWKTMQECDHLCAENQE